MEQLTQDNSLRTFLAQVIQPKQSIPSPGLLVLLSDLSIAKLCDRFV